MKHLLSKSDQKKVQFLDQHENEWQCYLNTGFTFNMEDGASFSEDTLRDVKATLKRVYPTS